MRDDRTYKEIVKDLIGDSKKSTEIKKTIVTLTVEAVFDVEYNSEEALKSYMDTLNASDINTTSGYGSGVRNKRKEVTIKVKTNG